MKKYRDLLRKEYMFIYASLYSGNRITEFAAFFNQKSVLSCLIAIICSLQMVQIQASLINCVSVFAITCHF